MLVVCDIYGKFGKFLSNNQPLFFDKLFQNLFQNTIRCVVCTPDLRQETPVETLVTLYFDTYRTYIAHLEHTAQGLCLSGIHVTNAPVDLSQNLDDVRASVGMEEVERCLEHLSERHERIDAIAVSLDMDSVLAYPIPYSPALTSQQLSEYAAFELMQHVPDADPKQFFTSLYPFRSDEDSPMAFAVHVGANAASVAVHAAAVLRSTLRRISVSQADAHNVFAYNYADEAHKTVALCGVQDKYVDISVLCNNTILDVATLEVDHLSPSSPLGSVCKAYVQNLDDEQGITLDTAYFFGTDLTKNDIDTVHRELSMPVKRLNPLKMLTSTLTLREREYCSRIAHVLVPSVGSMLPEAFASIRL